MCFRGVRGLGRALLVPALLLVASCSTQPATAPTGVEVGGAAGGSGTPGLAGAAGSPTNENGSAGAAGSGGSAGSFTSGGVGGASASGGGPGGAPAYAFPNGAVAAVSLTYDDGLDPHLATVIPALDAQGFKGTFFLANFEGVDHAWALPNLKDPLTPRHMAWQAALANGHELAGHTVNHPCNSDSKAPGYHLTDYDLPRMSAELDDDVARLKRLGVLAPITFAYPCMSDKIGLGPTGTDYSPLVAARFFAARTSDVGIADPHSVNLLHVPLMDAGAQTGAQLKAMVDQAILARGWLVVLFHGVGTDQSCPNLDFDLKGCMINYLTTATDAHQALVDYLAQKKAQVWTAPFGTVAKSLRK